MIAAEFDADGMFSVPLQINYEDTDAGGVVYYGNYPGYMERARNAYLRSLGYPLRRLAEDHQILFVVTRAEIEYLAPARLDDVLSVTLEVLKTGGAEIVFGHRVLRGENCLARGVISLALLNSRTFKPRRIPKFLKDSMAV